MNYDEALEELKQREKPCHHCEGTGKQYRLPGDTLWGFRQMKLLTQKEVARRMDISPQYLVDLEHDRRPWSGKLVRAYLRALFQEV